MFFRVHDLVPYAQYYARDFVQPTGTVQYSTSKVLYCIIICSTQHSSSL